MKRKISEWFSENIGEAIVEIVLMFIFFAIGFIVCLCISPLVSIDTGNFENVFLIGFFSLIGFIIIFSIIKRFVKKLKNKYK